MTHHQLLKENYDCKVTHSMISQQEVMVKLFMCIIIVKSILKQQLGDAGSMFIYQSSLQMDTVTVTTSIAGNNGGEMYLEIKNSDNFKFTIMFQIMLSHV